MKDERWGERGVQGERDGDPEAHLLEGDELAGGEAGEDDDDDRRRTGDQTGGRRDAVHDRAGGVAGGRPALMNAAEHEYLVVHREAEQHAEQEDGDPRQCRPPRRRRRRLSGPQPLPRVAVGEHLGYLLTGAWTTLTGIALTQTAAAADWVAVPGIVIGPILMLCSLEFVGRHELAGWKLAERLTPIAYIAWSPWLIVTGIAFLA